MEAGLQQTPSADRIHIAFFGRRNAGKSSLVNAITNQTMSIVSEIQGTTTDPVRKAMELLPLGAVVIIDTPGLDDEGTLGTLRMQKTKEILHRTDLAVIVINSTIGKTELETKLEVDLQQQQIPFLEVYNQCDLQMPEQLPDRAIAVSAKTGFHISEFKEKMATCYQKQAPKTSHSLLGNFIQQDDIILLVTPIDESAPKGRMILPQVQAIRSILDEEAICLVVQPQQLQRTLSLLKQLPKLVVTDSQAFQQVNQIVPPEIALTSFSILYAHYHDVLQKAVTAATTLEYLQNHDHILIAEGCTHHRQCNDIGTVKLPNWIQAYTGKTLDFTWTSGNTFPDDLTPYRLIVHCGGCMFQPRAIQYRKELAAKAGVPFTNYGTLIAYVHGILRRSVSIFPELQEKMPHHIHETD